MSRFTWFVLFLALGVGLRAQISPSPDRCKCAVVNTVFTIGGDCKCSIPGTGSPRPAFSVSEPVFPDGIPADGVCTKNTCTGNNECTYKPIQVVLTIAACARTCTGHDEDEPDVNFRRTPDPTMGSVPSTGSVGFGQQQTFTSGTPSVGSPNLCGSGPFEESITFLKQDGQHAFKIVFQFGCGNCRG
jgi:hypothetical protein